MQDTHGFIQTIHSSLQWLSFCQVRTAEDSGPLEQLFSAETLNILANHILHILPCQVPAMANVSQDNRTNRVSVKKTLTVLTGLFRLMLGSTRSSELASVNSVPTRLSQRLRIYVSACILQYEFSKCNCPLSFSSHTSHTDFSARHRAVGMFCIVLFSESITR